MNNKLMFSKASDEWSTPQTFFDLLAMEFLFSLDVAASVDNAKVPDYLGLDAVDPRRRDAMSCSWRLILDGIDGTWRGNACWMNPPYSRCREFIAKAAYEASQGVTTVCLLPSRTDTRWWHEHVYDRVTNQPRAGVEVRFLKGRLRFGATSGQPIRKSLRNGPGSALNNSAPFPSVIVVFRPSDVICQDTEPRDARIFEMSERKDLA